MAQLTLIRQAVRSRLNNIGAFRLGAAALVVIFLALELINITRAWLAVENAARFGVRYAATGQFDSQYCDEASNYSNIADDTANGDPAGNCNVPYPVPGYAAKTAALIDWARLPSIVDAAFLSGMRNFYVNIAADPAESGYLHVEVCSDRTGFELNVLTGECLPMPDAGGPGDKVLVSVIYNYPVGSSIGADIHSLSFQATREAIVETYRTARVAGLPGLITATEPTAIADTGSASSESSTPAVVEDRIVITTIDVHLLVRDTNASLTETVNLAETMGGYVAESQIWYDGEFQYAKATIRVPANQYRTVLEQLKRSALRLIKEDVVGNDVTEEYVDLQSRLGSVQLTAKRVEAFLTDAATVREALTVNSELAKLEAQLEQIKGRIQYLDNRAEYAAITIAFEPERPLLTPPRTDTWQPMLTVQRAVTFLGKLFALAGDLLIWAGVVGVPCAILLGGGMWITRKLRQKRKPQ